MLLGVIGGWHAWLLFIVIVLLIGVMLLAGWLWQGRIRCRERVRHDATEHFVRGTVFCLMHRTMFPEHQVPVGIAFDPNHRHERDRVLVEWGAFGDSTEFDMGEWESAVNDRRTPFDYPEAEGA